MGDMAQVELRGASMRFGDRRLWGGLDLDVAAGEFVAILGPNGAGKSTLLKVLLGILPLSEGTVRVCGREPRLGAEDIGYIPQQTGFDRDIALRGRDLVGLGLDGNRWGIGRRSKADRQRIDDAIARVGASGYADRRLGRLSGGEQQRLRIAQALLGDPAVLLCDEPLLSLDLAHQQAMTALIDQRRRAGSAVLFVTHEINPILPVVDRVLYLVGERCALGTPDEVLTSAQLSALYGTEIDVLRVRDRIVVVGVPDAAHGDADGGGHHHPVEESTSPGRARTWA
jgi:zinc/manganese transport system ATP-binding protein